MRSIVGFFAVVDRRPQTRHVSYDGAHPTEFGDELIDRSRLHEKGEGRSLSYSDRSLRVSPHDNVHDSVPGSIDAPKHELGTAPCVTRIERADLYEVIRQRYERGSMIVTSNRSLEEWPPLFLDALMASAAMDRLLHDANVVVMDGDSYRNPPPTRRKKTRPTTTSTVVAGPIRMKCRSNEGDLSAVNHVARNARTEAIEITDGSRPAWPN